MNRSALAAALLMLSACRAVSNYQSPLGPRYAADLPFVSSSTTRPTPPALRVVDTLRTSDHDPVWAVALLAPALPD